MGRRRTQGRDRGTARQGIRAEGVPRPPVVTEPDVPPRPGQVHGVEGLVGFIATGALDEHLGVSRAVVERRRSPAAA